MSIWTRLLRWLASFLDRKADQQDADTAAITRNEAETHAVVQSQAAAPDTRDEFIRRVRDGQSE